MAQKTRAALKAEKETKLADNTTGAITPQLLRDVVDSIVDSGFNLYDDNSYITAAGTNTYTATDSTITAYTAGQIFRVLFTNANTGAATLNINSLGAKNIKKNVSTALASGDIVAGQVYYLAYDGTNIQIVGRFATTTSYPYALFDHYTDVGNVSTGEDDLYSDTTAASTFASNGDKIEAIYGGTFAAHGTATRQVKVYFAGTQIFASGAQTTLSASYWTVRVLLIRVSSTVVRYTVHFEFLLNGAGGFVKTGELTGLTLSNTNILKLTGEAAGAGAATDDVKATNGTVIFYPHA
jgi:hypothetical protein